MIFGTKKKDKIMEKFYRRNNCTAATATDTERYECEQQCLCEIKKQLALLLDGTRRCTNEDLNIDEPEVNYVLIILDYQK